MSIRLNESRLRQIVREEARRTLSEDWRDMPGTGGSLDGDSTYLKCTKRHGFVFVDEAGPLNADKEDVQKKLNEFDPESPDDLRRLLDEIGIEGVICDGKSMTVDKFIDSLSDLD